MGPILRFFFLLGVTVSSMTHPQAQELGAFTQELERASQYYENELMIQIEDLSAIEKKLGEQMSRLDRENLSRFRANLTTIDRVKARNYQTKIQFFDRMALVDRWLSLWSAWKENRKEQVKDTDEAWKRALLVFPEARVLHRLNGIMGYDSLYSDMKKQVETLPTNESVDVNDKSSSESKTETFQNDSPEDSALDENSVEDEDSHIDEEDEADF